MEECSKIFCHSIILIGLVSRRILVGCLSTILALGSVACSEIYQIEHIQCVCQHHQTPSRPYLLEYWVFNRHLFFAEGVLTAMEQSFSAPSWPMQRYWLHLPECARWKYSAYPHRQKPTFKKDGLSMLMLVWEEQFQNLKIQIKYTHMAQQHQPA